MDNMPNTPNMPSMPNSPTAPNMPNMMPNSPATPNTPSMPNMSGMSSAPSTPPTPNAPNGGTGSVTPRDVLTKRIQVCDFICDEVALYLDTHPTDKAALDYFAKYLEMKKTACAEYAKNYGPMTIDAYIPGDPWKWVENPWPWEREV